MGVGSIWHTLSWESKPGFFLVLSLLPGVDGDPCVVQTDQDGSEAQTWGAGVGVFVFQRV